MRYKNLTVKGEGSEPILLQRAGEEGTLAWGEWTFVASVHTIYSPSFGTICHYISIEIAGGGDHGESGMFGELKTALVGTLEEASEEAKNLRMLVTSQHMEDDDDDVCQYTRLIDFSPAVDFAVKRYKEAVAEAGEL